MILNIIVKQDDNGSWYAYVPALPGCVSVEASRERVLETIKEAIQGFLETEEALQLRDVSEGEKIAIAI